MKTLRKLASLRQFQTETPEKTARDLGRFSDLVDGVLGSLPELFGERWGRSGGVVTANTVRPLLRFDELTVVDSQSADVRLYLPRASASDEGRRVQFVKKFADNAAEIIPTDGSLVNLSDRSDRITDVGLHEAWWDGSGWWLRGSAPSQRDAGSVQRHDLTHSPLGLWQFNESLSDSSGNGRNFTVDSGAERYSYLHPGVIGVHLISTRLFYNVADTALRITGDVTIEALIHMYDLPTEPKAVLCHEGAGETAATNCLYALEIEQTTGTLDWFSESGGGVDAGYAVNYGPALGQLCHIAARRSSNVIRHFLNGLPVGAASSALTTPADGSSGRLSVGYRNGALTGPVCCLGSLKLIGSALTDAQIAAEYNRTLGPAFGFI